MIEDERERRLRLWEELLKQYNGERIPPSILHQFGIYGGAQGIWRDTNRTIQFTEGAQGVTVGVLHTGSRYPDDWASDGVLYHYPQTNRPPTFDVNEIKATKTAGELKLPIFVISHNQANKTLRDVHLGWVTGWDDAEELFLILFSPMPPAHLITSTEIEEAFQLFEERTTKHGQTNVRPNQVKFRFEVFKRYGTKCALCDVSANELLDAAHLVPHARKGTNDPRNGLVMCVLHHKAFDEGLFGIEPTTTRIRLRSDGMMKKQLGIKYDSLKHLANLPHSEALAWAWQQFEKQ